MKNYALILTSFVMSAYVGAQTLDAAIKKTDNERYDVAAGDFRALIAKEPTKVDNYFYSGENQLKRGELDSALLLWQKAASIDPVNPLGMIAGGKVLWYNGDTATGRKKFAEALKLTKNKNAEIMRQMGATYLYAPMQNLDGAISILTEAVKVDAKNIDGFLLLGDALLEKTPENGTSAIKNYNKALELDAKNCRGIVRKAKLYQRAQNYEQANALYKEAQALDPTYAPAYRENAELNMRFDQFSKAIENWKKYLELNSTDESRYRFATALFSAKKYCEAIPELNTLQTNGFNNFYINRMLAYSLYECNPDNIKENNERGLKASDAFFQTAPKAKVISLDYKYRALHQVKMGNDSLAILEYEQASVLDPEKKTEYAGEMAKMHMKAKRYDQVIANYLIKMDGKPENLNSAEYFELGRAYYFGPKNYALADSAFAQVTKLVPDYASGYLWRGRANLKMDDKNAKWMAQPHYEMYLSKLTPEEKVATSQKSLQIEAGKYLGDYYVNSLGKDYAKAKVYWKGVQDLDPLDKQAKAFFASPAGK